MKRELNWLVISLAILSLLVAGCTRTPSSGGTLRIGVMLPLSGPESRDYRLPLEWALENINDAGGVDGKRLELVYVDIASEDLAEVTRRLAADDSILAVIGADTSKTTYEVASAFVQAQKVLITPSATSADIFRAFSQYKFIWRTVESDVAQTQLLLETAARNGAKKVALVTSGEYYGATFFDWFGFFATELGLEVTAIERYYDVDSCGKAVDRALATEPDVLFAVPNVADALITIAQKWRNAGGKRLLFSDAAQNPYLIQKLGKDAEGLEGITLSPDADNGFTAAFQERFNKPPTPYAANSYDALLLIAYGLERSRGISGDRLAEAIAEVVDSRGQTTGWDKKGIADTLKLLRSGKLPDITGATGPLEYDLDFHTDMTSSTYGLWKIKDGQFQIIEYLKTEDSATAISGKSAFQALASIDKQQNVNGRNIYNPGEKTGLWALIVATSSGWENYRHQADALAQYRLLRSNGVPDDHIILIIADDLAGNPNNKVPGVVRNELKGEDLYVNVKVDYLLKDVTADDLLSILTGKRSANLPEVIQSTAGDNIYIFLAGHGNENGIYLHLSQAIARDDGSYSILHPDDMAKTISSMFENKRYRRMLIAIESCQGGNMGIKLDAPGVILLSAANPSENSLSANYDPLQRLWLANQFAFQFYEVEKTNPNISLNDLYSSLYLSINGSHVSAYAPAFGDANEVKLKEFIIP
jgi:ABC-type branched-subunit amino acid transport system substrate-binding protein/glycosylphosphatidylinositol transamidase (GPIT) subunit GPI8